MKYLKVGLSVGLLAVLASRIDWARVVEVFGGLRIELWAAAVGVYLLAQATSALRWQLLARPLGFRLPFGHFLGFYFIGMFFNLVLPTAVGGDVVRAWYLDQGPGRRLGSYVSVLVDRGSGLVVLLALACVALLFAPADIPAWVSWSVWSAAAATLLAILGTLAVCFGPFALDEPSEAPAKGWGRLLEAVRVLPATYLSRPGVLLTTTLISILVQAANVILVWLIGEAVHAPVPFGYYFVVVPMVSLLTMAPISLNGMGLREYGMVVFLAAVGARKEIALPLAFLWFMATTCASLSGGLVYLLCRFPRPEVQADHEPVRRYSRERRTRQPAAAA